MDRSRQTYHHGNLPAAVLDEALVDVAGADPISLNIHRIAKGLGVTHSAIYRHYPAKQDVLDALAERGFRALGDYLAGALEGLDGADRHDRVIAMGLAYVRFAVENPTLMRVTFSSAVDRRGPADLAKMSQRAIGYLHTEVLAAADEGLLKASNPADVTRYLWAGIHGEAMLRIEARFAGLPGASQDADELTERTARWLVGSVVATRP